MKKRHFGVRTEYQRYIGLWFVLGLVVVYIMTAGLGTTFLLNLTHDPNLDYEQITILINRSKVVFLLMTGIFVLLAPFWFYVGARMSQRFVGPLSRIEAWIEGHLLNKNPKEIRLRPDDDLYDVLEFVKKKIKSSGKGKG